MLDAVFIIIQNDLLTFLLIICFLKRQMCSPYDHAVSLMLILNVVTSNYQTSDQKGHVNTATNSS